MIDGKKYSELSSKEISFSCDGVEYSFIGRYVVIDSFEEGVPIPKNLIIVGDDGDTINVLENPQNFDTSYYCPSISSDNMHAFFDRSPIYRTPFQFNEYAIIHTAEIPVIIMKGTRDGKARPSYDVSGGIQYSFNEASNSNISWYAPASNSLISNAAIYHDIYIEGNDSVNNIYIHTHHNIDYGRITSYRYNSIGNILPDVYKHNGTDGTYEFLGNSQYDKGMIQQWTFEQFHALGVKNTQANSFIEFANSSCAIKFKDNIVSEHYPMGENHFTNYALIHKNKTHILFQNTSGEEISPMVFIRFFDGAPPEDVTHNSDSGDDRDDTNYDGTPKDPRTKEDYDDEGELTQGSDEGSAGIFNDIYKVTTQNMKSLHNKLWTQEYFNVLKVNENPIENILSCKRLPFDMTAETETSIIIGNIDTGVNGAPVLNGVKRYDVGSIYVGEKFRNFLDYYQTNYSIYLPFIGIKKLEPTQIVGHTIIVKYIIDIMTGICKAQLYLDSVNFLFAEYDGQMGIDCTLTSSNQKQSEIANAMRFATIGVGLASGNPMGIATAINGLATNGVENHFESTQTNSAISNASVTDCYLIYDEPEVPIANGIYPNNYKKTVGLPCGKSLTIGECSGYTKCGGDVQGTFDRATSEEVNEIMSLLQNGIEV